MNDPQLAGLLEFLRAAERLKVVHRSGYTSAGEPESVAEHTWRLALMALLLAPEFPEVDFARLVKICLVHDLGEAIGGDVPAPEQARRAAAGATGGKAAAERRDLLALLAPLPAPLGEEITALWDEYEAAQSPEASLAKALDKLETILQHTQGRNPPEFDYRFNLGYGRQHTGGLPLIAAIRAELDRATAERALEAERRRPQPRGAAAPEIRELAPGDFGQVWPILRTVVAGGDTFAWPPELSMEEGRRLWTAPPARAYVARLGDVVVGSYFLRPNQPGLGDHVANAGYIVAPEARGRGIARALCEHSLEVARAAGFDAMQFNFVVSTNEGAVRLWQQCGFTIAGRVPRAFRHRDHGPVDVFIMHRFLGRPGP